MAVPVGTWAGAATGRMVAVTLRRCSRAPWIAVWLLHLFSCHGIAAEIEFKTLMSLPPSVRDGFAKSPLSKRYRLSAHINPFYLHGDFNGDGHVDTAVLIKEIASGKNGIVIYLGKPNRFVVIGAGQDWDNGDDDFPGLDAWQVFHRGPVPRGADGKAPPKLRGDALYVIKTESASALVYWNGRRFAWYQQGD